MKASGVCDLVSLVDDISAITVRGEAIVANGLELEVKRMILKRTVSDHMPVSADISIGSGYGNRKTSYRLPETHMQIVRTSTGRRFGRQYESINTFGRKTGAERRAAKYAAGDAA